MADLSTAHLSIRQGDFSADSHQFGVAADAHRHNAVELVYGRGNVTLIFDGKPIPLAHGESAIFWAVVPHFSLRCDDGTALCWVHVPLRQYLDWRISPNLTQRLLRGQIVRDPSPRPPSLFLAQLERWHRFSTSGSAEMQQIVELEVEALFRETALSIASGENAQTSEPVGLGETGKVDEIEAMVSFIARNYHEPIAVADVAGAAGLKPGYAMRRFRAGVGSTIVACINEHRLGFAQRMLVTTDATVLEILIEAGFGSVTQFYSLFERRCGCTPTQYRERAKG